MYGIRHHGPGSARALARALEAQPPDALAIELPADLQAGLSLVGAPGLVPPVALVAFEPQHVERALYYPLARFSPEWIALTFCAARGIPVFAMDLPATLLIAHDRQVRAAHPAQASMHLRSSGAASTAHRLHPPAIDRVPGETARAAAQQSAPSQGGIGAHRGGDPDAQVRDSLAAARDCDWRAGGGEVGHVPSDLSGGTSGAGGAAGFGESPDSLASGGVARPTARALRIDPLGELARLAGYTDRERWWERTFELRESGAEVFPATTAMIAALREAYPEAVDAECVLRERHMARTVVQIAKAGHARIAVVCGAWHTAALAAGPGSDPLKSLRKLAAGYTRAKAGLKGPKLATTWIPWTYERLRTGAGYGAGVRSPQWYDLLFDDPGGATAAYLTRIARELRELGAAASTARVVDAVDLAGALRDLRGLDLAGLDELHEAALAALTQGAHPLLDEALTRVESGRTAGRVPVGSTALPLQVDLEARLRAVRLLKPYRDMEPLEREFDLRKPAHLAASQLVHQLLLLGIPFGEPLARIGGALGTFREGWRLHWRPDFAVGLIGAHRYGQRVESAAREALRERLDEGADLLALTRAIDLMLLAGLFDELDTVAERLRAQAAAASDAWLLARVLPELIRLSRYPSLRTRDAGTLDSVVAAVLPKLAAGLAMASRDLDEGAARTGFDLLRQLQPYVAMVAEDSRGLWLAALRQVSLDRQAHPLLLGFALRTLADADAIGHAALVRAFEPRLTPAGDLAQVGDFLEGFLYSSAQVLLHEPAILRLLDDWLAAVPLAGFRDLLPALRRTFAGFSRSDRRKLAAVVSTLAGSQGEAGLSPKPDPPSASSVPDPWPELEAFLRGALGD